MDFTIILVGVYVIGVLGSFVPWVRFVYHREPDPSKYVEATKMPHHHMGWAFGVAIVYSLVWPFIAAIALVVYAGALLGALANRPRARSALNKIVGADKP